MLNNKLVIHHIGARGPTQAFPAHTHFESSIVNVLYEADPSCIEELVQLNDDRQAQVVILNECVSGSNGLRTFCDAHHAYGSSLLEANPALAGLYMQPHWVDYDYTVYEAISARSRRQVTTRTIDQIVAQYDHLPLPDFLSLDTQGSELEILRGSPLALESTVCIVTEVEFLPIYKNQPLFGDVCSHLTNCGFVFAKFFPILSGSLYRAPLGLRTEGLPVTTDALFLRDPRSLSNSNHPSEKRALRLAKLAFFSIMQAQVEHALWSLREAEAYSWKELACEALWFDFIKRFSEAADRVPALMPETFSERHASSSLGKEVFVQKVLERLPEFNAALNAMVELLRGHGLGQVADALLRQTRVDLTRLGIPAVLSAHE